MASAIADVHFRMTFHNSMNDQARSHLDSRLKNKKDTKDAVAPDEVDKKTTTSPSCS
jgi:hypothetical protein